MGELERWLGKTGFYARVVDVHVAFYRVRDIQPGSGRARLRPGRLKRCAPDLAQLWFTILETL